VYNTVHAGLIQDWFAKYKFVQKKKYFLFCTSKKDLQKKNLIRKQKIYWFKNGEEITIRLD